jgi:carbon-monoxide dehydrogenase medium subunit
MRWKQYEVMNSVAETLQQLSEAGGLARVVAGGTDLFVQIREMGAEEESLVLLDISRIEALRGIHKTSSHLNVGAAVTMTELSDSPLVRDHARALGQGAAWLGSRQIRNVATIGGNVVNAMPAADTLVPLVALNAEAHIISPEGERFVPVETLCLGVGKCSINPSREFITHFRIPLCSLPHRASAMQRLAKRKEFTLPQLSVAVTIEVNEKNERFVEVKIVGAPLGPTPWRARAAEEHLGGAVATRETVTAGAELARKEAVARDSLRAGAAYRKDMLEVLTIRALQAALDQLEMVGYADE